jgi:NAD(P)-dependent dehydrogenase (short-subunit alcohol dehydrogenase family)
MEGYSEALRRELILFGVDVVVVAPGAIATPIWGKVDEDAIAAYANTPYAPMLDKVRDFMIGMGRKGLPPAAVGALVWRIVAGPRGKVRHRILKGEFFQMTLPRMLPARMVDGAIAGMLGLKPAR